MNSENPESFDSWVGRLDECEDPVSSAPVRLLLATLDNANAPALPSELPPLWHWLYFLPGERQSNIDTDGHPKRGGFLPPVQLPRRMWAGGRLQFLRPLALGAQMRRVSVIKNIQSKTGRSGQLVFVTVQHDIFDAQGLAIREEQDLVYRDAPTPGTPAPKPAAAPNDEQFARIITPDPVLLMRYSALTFNGHRIHYDRTYAMQEEGYPGLVVHGPLIATLLMEELRRAHPHKHVKTFVFKAVGPLFDTAPFTVAGKVEDNGHTAHLWARAPDGQLAMQASAEID
ncbi:FAS1-like dehydratase domain-containing protein [Polaromonas glacialis]|uniref:FAS1-like dehydratase domain-containing protein n=1 Tax=Polaromonas glacialis TaxID=866564 RepID=UPI00049822C1|nr:MaoC family dehydratase N-terminal domain-containing protein [Polaromonas glacialis]